MRAIYIALPLPPGAVVPNLSTVVALPSAGRHVYVAGACMHRAPFVKLAGTYVLHSHK